MDDIYLEAIIGDRTICVSPLARKSYAAAGGKGLGGDYGYFVYEYHNASPNFGIEIIAKAASLGAAERLFDLIVGNRRTSWNGNLTINGEFAP
ncbi:hypothetical protein [Ahrensia sp. R2A130]|uniref:hypothetical protein n=1 Tax=Ahrensia sp. R2A130 TaxID=744979 RepID=UPI0001E0E071|nr:hypothetical protein [Ahrensia sp. R2A130]EFL89807.1 acyltransferase [Ahrensia sp. R2A130]